MKKISIFGGIVIACLTMWLAFLIYDKATDGFNIRQISSSLSEEFFLDTRGNSEEMKALFDSPISYIGKGCQSYVCESKNKKYVIKFFKHKHLRSLHWLEHVPLPASWITKKITKRDNRIRHIFESCQLSYDQLAKETGVVFVHLNRKPFLNRHITLIDKLGIPQQIYLDEFQFVIQKKAIPLTQMMKTAQSEQAINKMIGQVCEALIERMNRGIEDRDPAVARNMAYLPEEDRMLFIDLGQFYPQRALSDEERRKELVDRLRDMAVWAEKHAPHMTSFIQEKIIKINYQ